MRNHLSLLVVGLVCAPALAQADDTPAPAAPAAAPAPDYTLTANVSIVSQYIYRGLTQSDRNPAIQGGFDFSHKSGFYLGTWGSSISWVSDNYEKGGLTTDGTAPSAGMEWDFYGGYKGSAGDIGYDVGALQYYYPGNYPPLALGVEKPDTTEIYGALSYKWLSGKASYVVSKGLFGVGDARGSYYLDLSANYPIADTWTINAHVGYQKYTGTNASLVGTGESNSDLYTYTDWKLGITKDLGSGWSALAYYSDTNANDSAGGLDAYRDSVDPKFNKGKNLGAAQLVVGVSRSF
ncbi:MAG TPA: TorF family putative porin [Thiobacillaceae bacterium]|nr:TorF family putative porin [Thiobacillaceae bacterium]